MTEFLSWITANQTLLITSVVAFTFLINKIIDFKAQANSGNDAWDRWQPTSHWVTGMVFQGAEWYGKVKGKSGDEKLAIYLDKLKEFEQEFTTDKIASVQKLIAWYLSMKAKVSGIGAISANPSLPEPIEPPIGPDDVAEEVSNSQLPPNESPKI